MLNDRVALVTHVAHFVGRPAAVELAVQGATVLCHDDGFVDPEARDRFAADHPGLEPLAEQTPDDIAAAVERRHERIDILVHNDAFPAIRAPVDDARIDDMRAGLEALVTRPFALTGAVVPMMKRARRGKIVFVTSAAPLRGLPNYAMYVAARGAANALALSLAKELAPFDIQVNALAPNFVESPTYFPESLLADPEARKKIVGNVPLGRLARPDEAAAAIAFLASDRSGFITGTVLPFAGGWA